MTLRTLVRKSTYRDSVALMLLSKDVADLPGVERASAMMGTPSNQAILDEAGLLDEAGKTAGPNDLVLAVRARTAGGAEAGLAAAVARLDAPRPVAAAAGTYRPRTIDAAVKLLPGANLALISVPGLYAKAEAMKAIRHGLHVLLFSDNVSLEEEVALKRAAERRGLLMMGPDCGTAILNGVPLAFANAIPRGRIGVVAASGTGLQEVACLLAAAGEGISQAIGTGGRDLAEAVGGISMRMGLRALAGDPATEVLVLLSKPPAPAVLSEILAEVRRCPKPCVVRFMGASILRGDRGEGGPLWADTLEDAARLAVGLRRGTPAAPVPFDRPLGAVEAEARQAAAALAPGQRAIEGIFAGGTLAVEARLLLDALLGPDGAPYRITDFGVDEFTRGRPHPMLDGSLRREAIVRAAGDPRIAVILFDVVLGYGAHPDPAGDLGPALAAARETARAAGRGLALVASVCGTEGDPQGRSAQVAALRAAGVLVMPSNAQAARMAALIASRNAALSRLAPAPLRAAGGEATPGRATGPEITQARPAEAPPLFAQALKVLNVGLEGFALDLERLGVPVLHLDWSPPAGGDARLGALLAALDDEEGE